MIIIRTTHFKIARSRGVTIPERKIGDIKENMRSKLLKTILGKLKTNYRLNARMNSILLPSSRRRA